MFLLSSFSLILCFVSKKKFLEIFLPVATHIGKGVKNNLFMPIKDSQRRTFPVSRVLLIFRNSSTAIYSKSWWKSLRKYFFKRTCSQDESRKFILQREESLN